MNARSKPLTDPMDVITLLGRFASSAALCVLTIVLLVKGFYAAGAFVGVASLFFQRSTVKLWQRLRDERIVAEAELAKNVTQVDVSELSPAVEQRT